VTLAIIGSFTCKLLVGGFWLYEPWGKMLEASW